MKAPKIAFGRSLQNAGTRAIWLASEYINQSCDLTTYVASGGSCGKTRTALANWGTRISLVTP